MLLSKKTCSGVVAVILFFLFSTGVPAYAATNGNPIDPSIETGQDSYVGNLDDSPVRSHALAGGSLLGADRKSTFALRANTFVGKVTAHWPHKSGSQASGHVTWELKWGSAPKLRTTSELWSYSNGSWVKRATATATVWHVCDNRTVRHA